MNGILNETRSCYCDISDLTNNFPSRLRQIKTKSQYYTKHYGTVVEEYELNKPEFDEV